MNLRILSRRPALVALLTVLSASAALAQPNSVSVFGSINGHAVAVVQGVTLQAAGGGTGDASHIGRFNYTMQATVNGPIGVGVFLLSFSNGDVIYGSFSGLGEPTITPNVFRLVETLTIKGGTGRFQGAAGSLTFDRLADVSELPNFDSHSGTVTGTISTPK